MKRSHASNPVVWLAFIQVGVVFVACSTSYVKETVAECKQGLDCLPPEPSMSGAGGSKPGDDAGGPSCLDYATEQGWQSVMCADDGGQCSGDVTVATWDCPGGCCEGPLDGGMAGAGGGGGAGGFMGMDGGSGAGGGGGSGGGVISMDGGLGGEGGSSGAGGVINVDGGLGGEGGSGGAGIIFRNDAGLGGEGGIGGAGGVILMDGGMGGFGAGGFGAGGTGAGGF